MNSVLQQQAKWYVKQVLDAIDCEDQTNKNMSGIILAFILTYTLNILKH